jgi:NADH:ubiquinone oxidoreductase subunit 5 (subunit L)/multisubunit Na+/H+ antiporter MnhA subunit
MYMVRLFNGVFLGEARWPSVREGSPIMLVVVASFAGLSLAAGLAATPLLNTVNGIVQQMLGG